MEAKQTEQRLKEMLREAGVDLERPEPLGTWQAFGKFGAEEIDGIEPGDDGFLFWWGAYGPAQPFQVGFLSQFSFHTGDGEYDHMEQLRCTFHFEPTPELGALGKGDDWWFRSEPRRALGDWIAEIEAQPAFGLLRDGRQATAAYIEQGRI